MVSRVGNIFLWIAFILVVMFVILALTDGESWYVFWRLGHTNGIKVIEADNDVGTWARIEVMGRGPILLHSLSRESFQSGRHIVVRNIGDFAPMSYGCRPDPTLKPSQARIFASYEMDVGSRGEFAELFDGGVGSLDELFSAGYDKILNAMKTWPSTPGKAFYTTNHFRISYWTRGDDWFPSQEEKEKLCEPWGLPFDPRREYSPPDPNKVLGKTPTENALSPRH